MRRPKRPALVAVFAAFSSCLVCVVGVVGVARDAGATECTRTLVSTCINSDSLWPHAGPSQFLGFGGSDTTAAGQVGFGLVTSWLSRPLILRVPSPGTGGTDQAIVDNQVNGTFLFSYGVTSRLELGVAVPVTFGQTGAGLSPLTGGSSLSDTAMRDMRFGFAYGFVQRKRVASASLGMGDAFGVAARFEVSAPTGDRAQFAGERSAVFVPSVAFDYRRSRWFAGIELGLRARATTDLLGARVGTQGVIGAGVGGDLLRNELLSLAAEARFLPIFAEQADVSQGTNGLVSTPNGTRAIPAEWAVSVRSAPLFSGDLGLQLGGGGPIPLTDAAPTAPRFRFSLSVRYAPQSRDTDGDGVLDKDDRCPLVAARALEGKPRDGCPHEPERIPPPLNLAQYHDTQCVDEPDTVDGFRDSDGCPDIDSDKDGIDDRHDQCPGQEEDWAGLVHDGCPETRKKP